MLMLVVVPPVSLGAVRFYVDLGRQNPDFVWPRFSMGDI